MSSSIVQWSYSATWSRTCLSMKRERNKAEVRDADGGPLAESGALLAPDCILATDLGDTSVTLINSPFYD